jgi:CheY-like chemotaxis protein
MSPKTILVVEDDLAIRETVVELLKEEGYPKVVAARHGKEALAWLEAQTELPGLILLDLMMPVMDGESFMEALQHHPRAALHDVPVAILTASRQRSNIPGATTWLDKPIDIERLLALVASYCGPTTTAAPPVP